MNYIYLGVSDLYLPAAAAAIHLGQLEKKKKPTKKELLSLPYLMEVQRDEPGVLYFAGTDTSDNKVYIAWINAHPDVVMRAVNSLLGLYQRPLGEVKVITCALENPQIGWICSILHSLRLSSTADRLGFRVIHNRFNDLTRLGLSHA